MKNKTNNLLKTFYILLIFTAGTVAPLIYLNLSLKITSQNLNDDFINYPNDETDALLKSSDVTKIGSQFSPGTSWWNQTWSKRIGIQIENKNDFDRYEPIDVYLTFEPNTFYKGTERLITNITGSWSDPIPIQLYNKSGSTNYYTSFNLVFIANVTANSNSTYYLYYHTSGSGIDTSYTYNTGFTSEKIGTSLNVEVKREDLIPNINDYKIILKEGQASNTLVKGTGSGWSTANYHTINSLAPERLTTTEADATLVFSAHLDETTDYTVTAYDYAQNSIIGSASTNISNLEDTGVTNGAFYFRGGPDDDLVTFSDAIESATGDPFQTDTSLWSMACWINPIALSGATTGAGTPNPFMAHAKRNRETFEIGINTNGYIVLYLSTDTISTSVTFNQHTPITTTEWHFIALKVDLNNPFGVGVCLDNYWNYTNAWYSASNTMNGATDRSFTIGGSLSDGGVYFKGKVDEVQFYSDDLDEDKLDTNYKYSSNPSSLITGQILSINSIPNKVGKVFSQYSIQWNPIGGSMWVNDIITFYWDYNLWNIRRTIYFGNEYSKTGYGDSNGPMIPLNTYYDVSNTNSYLSYYMGEGGYYEDLTDPTSISNIAEQENFTAIYCLPNTNDDVFGIFIQDWSLAGGAQMNNFNGSVAYDSEIVEIAAGANHDFSNTGGSYTDKKLTVNFWELIDSINSSQFNLNEAKNYLNDVHTALKNPMNQYIYSPQSLIYDIVVYVTDHDDNVVPYVTIDLCYFNGSIIDSKSTDSSGYTLFQSIVNGSYTVNASYTNFGQTISIGNNITINDLAVESDSETKIFTANFSRVDLTSIDLNCSEIIDGSWTSALYNAQLNFTYSYNGIVEEKLTGVVTTNSTGGAKFRWKNATFSGYVLISILWYKGWETQLQAQNDLDLTIDGTLKFYFNNYTFHEINATRGAGNTTVTYTTSIMLFDINFNPLTDVNVDLDDSFTIIVNYSYVGSDNSSGPVTLDVNMNLRISGDLINLNPIPFFHNGSGIHILTMNTSELIESGGQAWKADVEYDVQIRGEDGTENQDLVIKLNPYNTRISTNESFTSADWYNMVSFDITYESNNTGTWIGLIGATLSYSVLEKGEEIFSGISLPHISGGIYRLSLNTTLFSNTGSYLIQISAKKQNYQTGNKGQQVYILDIATRINGTFYTSYFFPNKEIYLGESEIVYLSYTVASSGIGLSGSSGDTITEKYCNVRNDDTGIERIVQVIDEGNGIFSIDLGTSSMTVGEYTVEIHLKAEYYRTVISLMDLTIKKRDFSTTTLSFYSTVSGTPGGLEIEICIKDALSGKDITDISDGDMTITFLGKTYDFENQEDGCYIAVITNIPGDALIFPQLYDAEIRIERENYTTFEDTVTINVGLIEIWTGMPLFYFLIIVIGSVIVVSSLITYRVIQVRRIPTFIKKSKNLVKAISSEGKISDSLMYPSKEAFIAKKFSDNWKIHDLSLSEIMGIKKGKTSKTLSEDQLKDAKGGVA